MKTACLRISGRVQDVGFRAFARRLTAERNITGNVRNLSDGSVEIVAQGEKLESFLAECTGSVNITVMSWVKEREEFVSFLADFKAQWREHITAVDVCEYLGTRFYARNYLSHESQDGFLYRAGEPIVVGYDELDQKILLALATDARKPALRIARELDTPVRTVLERLRRLEKRQIILGYGINIDIAKLGREYYKLCCTFTKNVDRKKVLTWADTLPSLVYIDETLGKYDLELNVEVESREELEDILDQLKELTGGISTMDEFRIKRFRKLVFLT